MRASTPGVINMTKPSRVLVIDDHQDIRSLLARHLQREGYEVETLADGQRLWQVLAQQPVDLIILDLMLPGDDGLSLCRQLRSEPRYAALPIIMLTAKGEEIDRILGLEMGADDYMAKPFSARELLARVKAILRRSSQQSTATRLPASARYGFAGWVFDRGARQLETHDGTLVALSSGEFELLLAFVQRPGQVLSREQLLDLTRAGGLNLPFDRSIDTQVSRLRRKIEPDSKNPTLIKTVWGGGYVFTPEVEQR